MQEENQEQVHEGTPGMFSEQEPEEDKLQPQSYTRPQTPSDQEHQAT